ncbi:MAG: acyl-ACP desaturase [Candidatus Woesearchaeota archaeon]
MQPLYNEEGILEKDIAIRSKKRPPYTEEELRIIDIASTILRARNAVVFSLDECIGQEIDRVRRDPQDPKNWQPSQYTPDFSSEDWVEEVKQIKSDFKLLPLELLIVLIGDMITEEGLPTYESLIKGASDATNDITGTDKSNLAQWTRMWTAEENRHGDVLNRLLYVSGCVNMQEVERTIQYLLASGFNPGIGQDPYKLFIYTSFQEEATRVSHINTAKLCRKKGVEHLYNVCNVIAQDEARHYTFYKNVMKAIFDVDPNGAMTAYAYMLKHHIKMPAHQMNEHPQYPSLFDDFAFFAAQQKVYTMDDYIAIMEKLHEQWNVTSRIVSTSKAREAQDYLGTLPDRLKNIASRKKGSQSPIEISRIPWLRT